MLVSVNILKPVLTMLAAVAMTAAPANASANPDSWHVPRIADLNLDKVHLQALVDQRSMVLLHEPQTIPVWQDDQWQPRTFRYATGFYVIDRPIADVRRAVTDYASHPRFMPDLDRAEVKEWRADRWLVEFHTSLKMPMMRLNIEYLVEHRLTPEGDIIYRLVDGDIDAGQGRWEFVELGPAKTLVMYTLWADIESASFVIKTVLSANANLKTATSVSGAALIMQGLADWMAPSGDGDKSYSTRAPSIPLLSKDPAARAALGGLARRGTVMLVHPEVRYQEGEDQVELLFVSAARIVPYSQDIVRSYPTRFGSYPDRFSEVKGIKSRKMQGRFIVDWKTDMGMGVVPVPFNYRTEYVMASADAMPFRRTAGDVRFLFGAWEWPEIGPGETILIYTGSRDAQSKSRLISKLGSLIPNRKLAVGISVATIMVEGIATWMADEQPQVPAPSEEPGFTPAGP